MFSPGEAFRFAARLYEQMAEFDLLTNQSQYRDFVEAKLKQTLDAYPGFSSDE
jgi:hypothetical protein